MNFALEYHNPATIGHLNTGQKLMVSAFQAVTPEQPDFTFSSRGCMKKTGFLNIILMFIGGSPGGNCRWSEDNNICTFISRFSYNAQGRA